MVKGGVKRWCVRGGGGVATEGGRRGLCFSLKWIEISSYIVPRLYAPLVRNLNIYTEYIGFDGGFTLVL